MVFWHEKPAWQLCVPITHSSMSATQKLGIRDRRQEAPPSQPAALPHFPASHPCNLINHKGLHPSKVAEWSHWEGPCPRSKNVITTHPKLLHGPHSNTRSTSCDWPTLWRRKLRHRQASIATECQAVWLLITHHTTLVRSRQKCMRLYPKVKSHTLLEHRGSHLGPLPRSFLHVMGLCACCSLCPPF